MVQNSVYLVDYDVYLIQNDAYQFDNHFLYYEMDELVVEMKDYYEYMEVVASPFVPLLYAYHQRLLDFRKHKQYNTYYCTKEHSRNIG